jgi:L-alanine-DL-glutamate epimerase-like enolase superfamily enzyme
MTEARRIVALASAFDVPVIPHGSSVYSYHLQICFPSCPLAEFLVMSPKADKIVSYFGKLFKDEPLPKVRSAVADNASTKPKTLFLTLLVTVAFLNLGWIRYTHR